MKKLYLFYLFTFPGLSASDIDASCAKIGASMYINLTDAIVHDLHIDRAMLEEKSATVEVLDISPVLKLFAEQMARKDYNERPDPWLKKEDLFETYYEHGVKNITAKYKFTNNKGQRDVFIASSLFNDYEYPVRFNGYLTIYLGF